MTEPRDMTGASDRPALARLLGGAGLAFVLRAFGAACAFALNVAIGRLLGAEGAGLYFLALSLASVGAVVSRLGLDHALLRFVSRGAARRDWPGVRGAFALGLGLSLAAGLGLALGLGLAAPRIAAGLFGQPDLAGPLRAIAPSICGFGAMLVIAESLKGLGRVRDAMLVSGVLYPVVALALIWPLAGMFGPSGAALAYALGTGLAALYGLRAWRRAVPAEPLGRSLAAGPLWRSARSLWVMSLVNSALLPWAPLFLLGIWGGAEEAGLLGAALRISVLVTFFLAAVNTVAAPAFAALETRGDREGLHRTASRLALAVLLASSPVLAAMLVWPGRVMGLFGPDFVAGAPVLAILALGQAVNAATGSVGYLLMMTGHERDMRNAALLAAAVMAVAAFGLIPAFGAVGAALAGALAIAAANLTNAWQVRRRLGFWVLPR
ncbi:polysaccharide biosynthesis C-terminal domain-containing protein [Rhodovulum sulfidophilum]|uniref:Polysaccharide biosynthesis C-terminal domain-containing protein n=2 Tax=Rhodovulum sulfidophilum TaxID=35806 RepID=A0ABS1RWL8_RHOSU|nr:polysaccharide biosynthesis C-terminal domain-containing protein [Rhodovulum sulfidophilum]MBL3610318.1 polysaccharide biosynthesis C-terminal domain-containing protein [Rhodovulum sulfidophilum]